jgi:hypothetical protein
MPNSSVAITAGTGTPIDAYQLPNGDYRQTFIQGNYGGYTGRFTTYRITGRAGTAGQNLAAIWNAAGSTVAVDVSFVGVDLYQTVIKAVTVPPPIIRTVRLSATPANGTAGFKVAEETAQTTNSSVSTWQDASADGTSSASALSFSGFTTANSANVGLTQEMAPRLITAAGYEMADRVEMLSSGPVMLKAGEGLGVHLNYTAATQNPITDMWCVSMRWEEYVE